MSKRAVLYARVSTDAQAEQGYSLPTQLAAMREYAARNNFTIVAEFADDCSGSIPIRERPKGRKIYDLAENAAIDAVILFTHDRTARDELVIEYLLFKLYLYERGIELHYSDTGIDPYTMEGNLVGYIKAHAATEERKKIRERSVRGKDAKAKNNRLAMTGFPPLGIRQVGKGPEARWMLDDCEISTLRLIFDWFQNGDGERPALTLRGIATKLTELKIPPPRSHKHWVITTIRNLLKNEIYTGRTYYGKTRMVNGKRVKQPRAKWIQIDAPELAVIDRETFDAVQERLQENRLYSRRNGKHEYLLSGFAHCGKCGRAVCGSVINSVWNGKKYPYPAYRCARHWLAPGREYCPHRNRHVVAHIADDAVWNWITQLLTDESALDEGLRAMADRRDDELEPYRSRLAEVENLLAKTEQKIKRLVSALGDETDETVVSAVNAEIKSVKKQREGLTAEKRGLEIRLSQIQVTPDLQERIKKQAAEIRAKLTRPTFEQKRQLFRDLNLQVIFHLNDNKERWLEVSCELQPESKQIVLNQS